MLRAVLLGVLSMTAVGCKGKDESPKSQVGVAAGKAIEVSGAVTLHHGTESRPLTKGDTVEGDDVIETGADGSVQIELAHNNATWELGANKKVKVRESLAWNEAKKDKSAKAVEQDSAAAGRHAERNAADTTVSAAAPAATETMPAPAPAPAEAPAPTAAPAPPVAPPRAAVAVKQDREEEKQEKKKAAPPPPPPPPKTVTRSRAADDSFGDGSLGLTGTGAGGGGTGDGIGLGGAGGKVGGGTSAMSAAQKQINAHLVELKKCFKETTKVTFIVDAQGRVKLAYASDVDVTTRECAEKVAQSIEFAASATRVTVEIAK